MITGWSESHRFPGVTANTFLVIVILQPGLVYYRVAICLGGDFGIRGRGIIMEDRPFRIGNRGLSNILGYIWNRARQNRRGSFALAYVDGSLSLNDWDRDTQKWFSLSLPDDHAAQDTKDGSVPFDVLRYQTGFYTG
jgi:hypothetical protein